MERLEGALVERLPRLPGEVEGGNHAVLFDGRESGRPPQLVHLRQEVVGPAKGQDEDEGAVGAGKFERRHQVAGHHLDAGGGLEGDQVLLLGQGRLERSRQPF